MDTLAHFLDQADAYATCPATSPTTTPEPPPTGTTQARDRHQPAIRIAAGSLDVVTCLIRTVAPSWDEIVAVGNLSPELAGRVGLELAKAMEQLPAQRGMPGGARCEAKYDGYLH